MSLCKLDSGRSLAPHTPDPLSLRVSPILSYFESIQHVDSQRLRRRPAESQRQTLRCRRVRRSTVIAGHGRSILPTTDTVGHKPSERARHVPAGGSWEATAPAA
jgi:hypothetical protein